MGDAEHEDYLDWLGVGLEKKWISAPVCATHNGLPMTADEEDEVDLGYDPCVLAIRLWY